MRAINNKNIQSTEVLNEIFLDFTGVLLAKCVNMTLLSQYYHSYDKVFSVLAGVRNVFENRNAKLVSTCSKGSIFLKSN